MKVPATIFASYLAARGYAAESEIVSQSILASKGAALPKATTETRIESTLDGRTVTV